MAIINYVFHIRDKGSYVLGRLPTDLKLRPSICYWVAFILCSDEEIQPPCFLQDMS